ncbi:MAG: glutamine-hydrolyzing GMP synthase [Ignavibacteriales bacterium]|nr:glutamine-hydrolyzing GMP synthase [Ignavibacteriales bacterium]
MNQQVKTGSFNMKKIIVADFGGQYAHLIARRVRECGVYSEIHSPHDIPHDDDVAGIIFSGGPRSVTEDDLLTAKLDILKQQVPVLGICYGHQLIAKVLGGEVVSHNEKEYGRETAQCVTTTPLFTSTSTEQQVWMSHGDRVEKLPENFIVTASTPTTPIAAYMAVDKPIFGVQFHPEVTHTQYGMLILQNFVNLCAVGHNWDMHAFSEKILDEIKQQAGNKKLLLLISGGVDSLVALALCIKALGNEQVFALHVDTGFMRYKESEAVMEFLDTLGFKNLKLVEAGKLFFERLQGVTNPEVKRKIIGGLFVEVMHTALSEYQFPPDEWILVQGTIYPDTIESGGTANASAIKTHHNRVKEIDELIARGLVIEPLKELYKDEVRALGRELNLPGHLVERRPFPGPGLAIRILANVAPPDVDESELMAIEQLAGQYNCTAKILPVKSVGVQGDFRTYRHPVLLSPDNSLSFRWEAVIECAKLIVNKHHTVNRVVLNVSNENPLLAMQEVYLTEERVTLLQLVDDIVQNATHDLHEIWQLPVVSLPLFTANNRQAFVLRPICSQDAMTADVYQMDKQLLQQIVSAIQAVPGAGPVFYDITTKPPATIEWE